MNKLAIVESILGRLREEVGLRVAAARAAHAEATHEESRAEDKYDTRGLEASYLAAGQVRQTAETASAVEAYASMFLKKFLPGEPADVGALVEMEMRGTAYWYFLGPAAGGLEVEHEGRTVLVLTPHSPLGQQLTGKKCGDKVALKISGLIDEYHIVGIS